MVQKNRISKAELNTPLLGQIPLAPNVCAGGDAGKPIAVADPNSPVSQVFLQIAGAIANTFQPVTTVQDWYSIETED